MLGKRLLLICVDSHSRCSYLQCSWWYGRISHHRLGRSRVLGNVTRLISLNILLRCFTNLISTSWKIPFHEYRNCSFVKLLFSKCLITQDHTTFRFAETFAGQAETTSAFRIHDHRSARLDIQYMEAQGNLENPMDLLTPSGFAKLI